MKELKKKINNEYIKTCKLTKITLDNINLLDGLLEYDYFVIKRNGAYHIDGIILSDQQYYKFTNAACEDKIYKDLSDKIWFVSIFHKGNTTGYMVVFTKQILQKNNFSFDFKKDRIIINFKDLDIKYDECVFMNGHRDFNALKEYCLKILTANLDFEESIKIYDKFEEMNL